MAPKPVLYSANFSPPVRTVWMTAKFIGLELDIVNVDFNNLEHLSEDFLKKNPSHTVPTLYDDGEYLWESAAICTYLIGKYGPKECSLYPTDVLTRARIDQRLYYNAAILFPPLLSGSLAVYQRNESKIPDSVVAQSLVAVDLLERYLQDGEFLVGNSLTLADLAVATSITNTNIYVELDKVKYARIMEWLKRVEVAFGAFIELNEKYIAETKEIFTARLALNAKNAQ